MVVFSVLRFGSAVSLRNLQSTSLISKTNITLSSVQKLAFTQCRHMSGKRLFKIRPSWFGWKQFKNELHFYTLLGVIPLGLIMAYCNIFIGPAQLAEIPEGYEPRHWEYFKHPIERLFSRYVYGDTDDNYERLVSCLKMEDERKHLRKQEKQMRHLMYKRGDYVGAYYDPATFEYKKEARESLQFFDDIRKPV